MIIQNTNFNIFYPKIPNLRRKVVDYEEKFTTFFLPFKILPIPDDAPEEIPRIMMSTINGHSSLNLSLTGAAFTTNYDEKFNYDWEKCLGYLNDRIIKVYDILDTLKQDRFLFSGLLTQIFINEFTENPVDLIQNKILKLNSKTTPFDVDCKITFVYEKNYYININVSNVRFFEGLIPCGVTTSGTLQEKANTVGITIDINDRYGFNYDKDYTSDYAKIQKILEITTDIINNKLNKLITEGVFDL